MNQTKNTPAAKTASAPAAAAPANEVALAAETAMLDAPIADASGYEEFEGAGFENQTSDDYTIPFLRILQAISPILNDRTDLKQGMLLNTVTGEGFEGKTGVTFVPSVTQHAYIEFKPREAGGGFVGVHTVNSDVVTEAVAKSTAFGDYKTAAGNELTETFSVYGCVVDADGAPSSCVIAFTGALIKKYKAWMTKAKTIQIKLPSGRLIAAPLMAHKYRLKTVLDKSPKGAFYNWEISFDGENALACRLPANDPVFLQAHALAQIIQSGAGKVAYETAGTGEDIGTGSPAAGGKPVF
jgi:hypothetical protein